MLSAAARRTAGGTITTAFVTGLGVVLYFPRHGGLLGNYARCIGWRIAQKSSQFS